MEDIENVKKSEPAEEKKTPAGKKHTIFDEVLDWVESFIFAGFVVLLIFIFLFRTVVVEGGSMNPTLYDSQRLILEHFNYDPQRGDIVVVNSRGLNKTIIKRCIGIAGDTVVVDYSDSSVTVNGEKIEEDYINEAMVQLDRFDKTYQTGDTKYEYVVPEDSIFVMGDNRNVSRDSRYTEVGFISNEDVLGKALFRFYPANEFKKLT